MSRDPRVEHLQRLHRQRRLRAAGQSHAPGRKLFALVLVSMILGVLLTVPGQGDVRAGSTNWTIRYRWIVSGYCHQQMGELVRMASTGGSHGLRTGRLHGVLSACVGTHGLGEIAAAETGFDLTQPGDAAQTVLAPDIAFVGSQNVLLLDVQCEVWVYRHWLRGPGAALRPITTAGQFEADSLARWPQPLHEEGAQLMPQVQPQQPRPALPPVRGELSQRLARRGR